MPRPPSSTLFPYTTLFRSVLTDLNVYHGPMYVESVPNRNSPPAILLRESVRIGSKVHKRTLANLSAWPTSQVDLLRGLLKGEDLIARDQAFQILRSLPHGHVAAVLRTLRHLGLHRSEEHTSELQSL